MAEADSQLAGRVEELEIHPAFAARAVDDVDATIRELTMRVQRVEHELRRLRDLFEAAEAAKHPIDAT